MNHDIPLALRGINCIPAQIPCLDKPALCRIQVRLVLDIFDTDTKTVFGEDHVFVAHLLFGLVLDLHDRNVNLIANPGHYAQYCQDDKQRDELPVGLG